MGKKERQSSSLLLLDKPTKPAAVQAFVVLKGFSGQIANIKLVDINQGGGLARAHQALRDAGLQILCR